MMKQLVEIPCTIRVVETRPDLIEFERRTIERPRHLVRFSLPNGHTVEATLTHLEMQKIKEIAPTYIVPEAADSPPVEKSNPL